MTQMTIDKKKPGWKKLLKKLNANKHNNDYVPFVVDPKKFVIEGCKKCNGSGYTGYKNGNPIVCSCVKITEEYKEHLKKVLEDEKNKSEKTVEDGEFKGFKEIDEKLEKEYKVAKESIDKLVTAK